MEVVTDGWGGVIAGELRDGEKTMAAVSLESYRVFFQNTAYEVDAAANEEKVRRILQLKEEKNVLILGHNYMHPLVFGLSESGARGDSLALARYAAETTCPVILMDGVRFMAETAKILNPDKKVLIASKLAGCSLADPVRGEDVRALKAAYPGVPVVMYVNSYADAKAEADICCTSSNALAVILHVVRTTGSDRVIFLPDTLMGMNLQAELDDLGHGVKLIYPGMDNGMGEAKCEVHEQFTVEDLQVIRQQYDIPKGHPRRGILAHWECPPDVLGEADFHGSTSQMANYIRENQPERVYLATECEMASNLAAEFPQTEFVRACLIFCSHMRQIGLDGILSALETEDPERHEITVDEGVRVRALVPIERMLGLSG